LRALQTFDGVNTVAEPLVFAAVDPGGDKIMRMAAQAAPIEAGAVHVPTHAPWLEEFKKEVLSFPASKHDDQIDTLSQALQRAFAPGPPRVQFGRY
jgi:predicted phage terminase large subunit-like protein